MSLQLINKFPTRLAEIVPKGFLGGHVEALIYTAALLGSEPAVHRTDRLLDDVLSTSRLTRRMRQDLVGRTE